MGYNLSKYEIHYYIIHPIYFASRMSAQILERENSPGLISVGLLRHSLPSLSVQWVPRRRTKNKRLRRVFLAVHFINTIARLNNVVVVHIK